MDNNNLPNLTLNPFSDTPPAAPVVPPEQEDMQQAAQFAQTPLTPEEQQLVDSFSAQIDLTDTTVVLQYGAAAQRKIADFSDTALERKTSVKWGKCSRNSSVNCAALTKKNPKVCSAASKRVPKK